jgi:hypothetical protein
MPHNEGNEVAERVSSPNHLMRNQLRHWGDRMASRRRTVGTRGWPAWGVRRDAGASRTWHPDGGPSGRGGGGSRCRAAPEWLTGGEAECEPLWGILSNIEPERAGSPKRGGWHFEQLWGILGRS